MVTLSDKLESHWSLGPASSGTFPPTFNPEGDAWKAERLFECWRGIVIRWISTKPVPKGLQATRTAFIDPHSINNDKFYFPEDIRISDLWDRSKGDVKVMKELKEIEHSESEDSHALQAAISRELERPENLRDLLEQG